jgi:hypothetical protein
MRDMVYNLPVLTPPRWVRSRTTPVALENLLYYLAQLLHHPARAHRVAGGRRVAISSSSPLYGQRQTSPADPDPLPDPLDFGVVSQRHYLGAANHRQSADSGVKARSDRRRSPARADPQTLISFDEAVRRTLKKKSSW